MTESGAGTACTIAGLLLFGRAPRKSLPQAGVRLMVLVGTDEDYGAQLDEILDGPLATLWVTSNAGRREFAKGGLVEKTATLLRPFIARQAPGVNDGPRRDKRVLYPLEAVREVLVNA